MSEPALAGPAGLRSDARRARPLERLEGWRRLPPNLLLGRVGYMLKTPIFASPFYAYILGGGGSGPVRLLPVDPWPGSAALGTAITERKLDFAGQRIDEPAPIWRPVGASTAWLAELHGFEWLRDLRALGGDAARRSARDLVLDWIEQHHKWDAVAWEPATIGRRLAAWLGQYEFFAASAEVEFRKHLREACGRQARHLARILPAGLSGSAMMAALKGLIYAGLCLEDRACLERGLALLARELPAQILADGGQIERCPSRHLAVLRDLIDLRALLAAAEQEMPSELPLTIERMAPMLRLFRHGDGGLALFNGGNEEENWQIDMVLQRADGRSRPFMYAPHSGFQRMQAGRSLVLVDAGAPPPFGLDGRAHAGTLSFEMSVGRERLIVNCGAHAGNPSWQAVQRATAAHSTVTLADTNSSRITLQGGFARRPQNVVCRREEADGDTLLETSHDGYLSCFGMIHHRRLYLASGGDDLRGEDRIERQVAEAPDRAVAVRFHLHPDVQASLVQNGAAVLLRTPSGSGWRLRAGGAVPALDDSVYLGKRGEVRRSRQVVLNALAHGRDTVVKWALTRESKKR